MSRQSSTSRQTRGSTSSGRVKSRQVLERALRTATDAYRLPGAAGERLTSLLKQANHFTDGWDTVTLSAQEISVMPVLSSTREIPLSMGKVALIDADDFAYINQWVWSYESTSGYAKRTSTDRTGKRRTIYLHRAVLRAKPGEYVDHKDHTRKLDCRKTNLRLASLSQNASNAGVRANSTSGATGVSWVASRQKWRAHIMIDRKQEHIGYFDRREDAILARDVRAKELFGEFFVPATAR